MSVVDGIGRVLVAFGGLFAVPAVGVALLLGFEELYIAYALRHPGRFGRVVVGGKTAGGQVAPVSGVACAWWRLSISQWREEEGSGWWAEVWSHASTDSVEVMTRQGTLCLSAELVGRELRNERDGKAVVREGWVGKVDRLVRLGLVPSDRYQTGLAVGTLVPEGVAIVAVGRMKGRVLGRSLWGMGVNGVSTLTLDEVSKRAWKQMRETWLLVGGLGAVAVAFGAAGYGLMMLAAAAFTAK